MLFSVLKHYLELYITENALKVARSLYCFTTSISHGVENYFPRLLGTGISNAILVKYRDKIIQLPLSLSTHKLKENLKYWKSIHM